jgi:hypothetical protein
VAGLNYIGGGSVRVEDDVGIVCSCKSVHFTVVSVCTIPLHSDQVCFEICVNLCFRRHSSNGRWRDVLSLWVSAESSTDVDFNKLYVCFGMFSHFLYDSRTDLAVMGFIAVNLVGEGIEETITYRAVSLHCSFYAALGKTRCFGWSRELTISPDRGGLQAVCLKSWEFVAMSHGRQCGIMVDVESVVKEESTAAKKESRSARFMAVVIVWTEYQLVLIVAIWTEDTICTSNL